MAHSGKLSPLRARFQHGSRHNGSAADGRGKESSRVAGRMQSVQRGTAPKDTSPHAMPFTSFRKKDASEYSLLPFVSSVTRYHPIIIIPPSSSHCHHPVVIISLSSSHCDHPIVTISPSPLTCAATVSAFCSTPVIPVASMITAGETPARFSDSSSGACSCQKPVRSASSAN